MKILCVDDEPDLLYLFSFVLTRAGHEVVQATNGADALERIAEGKPDVIVTDLMMPIMDGRALIERLKADPATARIPILLVTATPDLQVDADVVIPKMDGVKRLVEAVEGFSRGVA